MFTPQKKVAKNNVINRFLPVPQTVLKGLEREPRITDFTIIKELGVGSFGRVFLVKHNATQALYAMKAIDKRIKDNIEEKPYFQREMEIMYKIHHPNVVKLFGHFEDNTFCYFLMEYISRGNLYSLIENNVIKRNAQVVASILKDIISALYYLHHMNPPIIHRDLKPENILIDDRMRAKLSDFGWSTYLKGNYKRSTICGTPIYLAPEIVNNTGHDEKIDIWCVGVLMFELMTGQPPWRGEDVRTVKYNISQLKINWPRNMDKDAKDLIRKILRYIPEERPSLRTILMHPFFTKFYPNAVNCLQTPNSIGHKLYVISKDHPLTYNDTLYNSSSFNGVMANQNLPISYTNTTTTTINQINDNSLPKTDYTQPRQTLNYVTSLTGNNNTIQTNPTSYIINPVVNNNIIQTDYIQTRNTFTPLNKSILTKNDYYPIRYTYTKLTNGQPQTIYQNYIKAGNSIIPTNIIYPDYQDNEERINELVRHTVLGSYKNNGYKDNFNQNLYNNLTFSARPSLYQTQHKTIKPYSVDTLNDIFSDINLLNLTGNFSTNTNNVNSRTSNLNNISFDDYTTFTVLNDPEIIKWKEQEKLRRESERVKLSTLMNRYGMSLTPIYINDKYNFI